MIRVVNIHKTVVLKLGTAVPIGSAEQFQGGPQRGRGCPINHPIKLCFFALHLILREKSDIFGRDDLFFALHLILRENLCLKIIGP